MTIQEKAKKIFEAILEGAEVCAKKDDDSYIRLEAITVVDPGTENERLVGYYSDENLKRVYVDNKEIFKRVRLCDAGNDSVVDSNANAENAAVQAQTL